MAFAERCDASRVAKFGCIDSEDNCQVLRGWLTEDKVVQLKVFGSKALNIWKKRHKNKDFYIKVTPVHANRSSLDDSNTISNNDESQSLDIMETRERYQRWPIVEVAVSELISRLF